MGPGLIRIRWVLPLMAALAIVIGSPASAGAAALSIKIVGNHFVDGSGNTIRLLGVNHTSSEYGCVDGFGYDDGHFDDADAAAIASWHADAVRIPLNEDCWLGINGQPNSSEGADPALTMAGYRQEIENYVADLNAHGIYAILDLHWTAPGTEVALEQQPMPDLDHSVDFWHSVATTFKTNRAVVFDVFNEPFDPTDPKSGDDQNPADKVTWNCWENAGVGNTNCSTADYTVNNQGETVRSGTTYAEAGMQSLVNAIRATGATQPTMVGGLDYANDLSQWVDNAPNDPLNQEAASFHNYQGKACDDVACWSSTIAAVAANVPVVTGEFDEDNFDEPNCTTPSPGASTFDQNYMKWADSAGVSYLAWGWIVEPQDERDGDACSAFYLIENYANDMPAPPNGTAVHDHLVSLPVGGGGGSGGTGGSGSGGSGGSGATKLRASLRRFVTHLAANGRSIGFSLTSSQAATGTLTAQTVSQFAVTTRQTTKRARVSLGTVRFKLNANKPATIVLRLGRAARALLRSHRPLTTQVTITLVNAAKRRSVVHRTVTLR